MGLIRQSLVLVAKKGSEDSLVYSYERCVNILMERDEMDYDSAVEFMEHNVIDAYVGESTPVFVNEYNDDIVGCIVVDELQYPSIHVESNRTFNCTTFKCRNYMQDWVSKTWEKLTLIIGPMKDSWSFYNARVSLVAGSSYNNEEFVIIYDHCERTPVSLS